MSFKKIERLPYKHKHDALIGKTTVSARSLPNGGMQFMLGVRAMHKLGMPKSVDVALGDGEFAGALALIPAENGLRKVTSLNGGPGGLVSLSALFHKHGPTPALPCEHKLMDGMLIIWPPSGFVLRKLEG